jgi:hypothetical protein
METNTKLSILQVLKQDPGMMNLLLQNDTRLEAVKKLADRSNLKENFLNINFEQVKLLIYSLSL